MQELGDISAAYEDALDNARGDSYMRDLLNRTGAAWAELTPAVAVKMLFAFADYVQVCVCV